MGARYQAVVSRNCCGTFLLPENITKAYVRAINLSDQAQTLFTGLCMGSAETAKAVGKKNVAAGPATGSAAPRYTTPLVVVTDESLQNSYSHVQPVVDGFFRHNFGA